MEINVDSEKSESDENVTKVLTEGTSINCISSNENEILKKCFDSENTSDNSERDMRVVMEKISKASDGNEIRKRSQDFDTSVEFSGRLKKIKNIKWDDISHSLPLCKIYFEEAQDVIADLEKKLTSKGHRKCRLEKRVKSLNSMLQVMKNRKLLTEEMATKVEKNTSPVVASVIRRMLISRKNRPFPSVLKAFTTTLHFYSPKAYNYMRNIFLQSLPHPSTIRRWYQSVDGSPGICSEAILTVRDQVMKAKRKDKEIFLCLMVDEMSIMGHIEWDGHKFYGYEDFGINDPQTNQTEQKEAKNAMVFMAVGINQHIKIPIAYFLINSLTSETRAELVKKCLIQLESTGAHVIAFTFDGAASNIATAEDLGARLRSVNDLQPYFYHPSSRKKIFIMLDAWHMMKLVRNALGSGDLEQTTKCDKIENKENCCDDNFTRVKKETISWKYLEKLVNLQESQGLHAATKVRRRHLNFYKEKMKVRLAVQVLSASVASAFRYFENDLGLSEFKDSNATANFCQIMNDIFDLLNSRNRFCKTSSKQCIDEKNIEHVRTKVSTYIQYISELKMNSMPILETRKRMGFLGLIISLKSIIGIYDEYIADGNSSLKYLLTYKLSQDHLELFFSAIRSKSGNNNNPTAKQFESAFKRLLIHTEIKGSEFANCTVQDETNFLHIKSNESTKKTNGFDTIIDIGENDVLITNPLTEHDYYIQDIFRTANLQYIKDVIGYIAGFIVRQIESKVNCQICVDQLVAKTPLSFLQRNKCRGGLKAASHDVIQICEIAEKCFRAVNVFKQKNVLNYFVTIAFRNIPSYIFSDTNHMLDQGFLADHRTQIIKLIIVKYINLRLKHAASNESNTAIRIRDIT